MKSKLFNLVFLIALLLLSIDQSIVNAQTTSQAAQVYFPETRQFLQGKFYDYWRSRGGLPVFGYPLTPEFYENGYLVQYFERNRFEYHPEYSNTQYEILLGLLGRERLKAENRTLPPAPARQPGEQFFPETGYSLRGSFLKYWQRNGALGMFGYPVSPEFYDPKEQLTLQYFERARFEYHSRYAGTAYEVLLTLLGQELTGRLDPVWLEPSAAQPPSLSLQLAGGYQKVNPLATLSLSSNQSGEVRVTDGANRVYARFGLTAGVPVSFLVAGASGAHSLLFFQNGQMVGKVLGAFYLNQPKTGIVSGDPVFDGLYPRVKSFLEQDVAIYDSPLDGQPVRGYRSPDTPFIWLRDHVHQSKGFKYFEPEMQAALNYFGKTQRADGSLDDYFQYHKGYDVYKDQIEIEADREYLFVEGVWTAWQASGNDTWLRQQLPVMERALEHSFSDPRRWSSEYGLIKRAFTIDTWDFEQGSDGQQVRRRFDAETKWSIMHGDNTGAYKSARLLAQIYRYFGDAANATRWDSRATNLLENINRYLWNGKFYTHQLHLTPVDSGGVDEKTQLSLSNAYALNRDTLSQSQAAALLRTYQERRAQNGNRFFAEWYSINPPFPRGFGPPGEYVNGGIMPLVGGELARGAFEHGFEAYGLDILYRYWQLLEKTGGSYLWYYPDMQPGIITNATLPTDGWGSAAMLSALLEGLAGVTDSNKLYEKVELAPRWAATERSTAQVRLTYGSSQTYFAYNWEKLPAGLRLAWGGAQTQQVALHLLIPPGKTPQELLLNGSSLSFTTTRLESSLYLDAILPGNGSLEVRF